jgi:hypothetical protein
VQDLLGRYLARAATRLAQAAAREHRAYSTAPRYHHVVEVLPLDKTRTMSRTPTDDRYETFARSHRRETAGWTRAN